MAAGCIALPHNTVNAEDLPKYALQVCAHMICAEQRKFCECGGLRLGRCRPEAAEAAEDSRSATPSWKKELQNFRPGLSSS